MTAKKCITENDHIQMLQGNNEQNSKGRPPIHLMNINEVKQELALTLYYTENQYDCR